MLNRYTGFRTPDCFLPFLALSPYSLLWKPCYVRIGMGLVIKVKRLDHRLLTRVYNPLPVQAAAEAFLGGSLLRRWFLLRHYSCPGKASGPKTLVTYWNQCPSASFDCAVKLRNRSSRNILFAMSYGRDGSGGRHITGLQSAMLRSKQLRRLIHCYSLEGGFCLVVDLKLSF